MQDVFIEYMVKAQSSGKVVILKILIVLAAIIVSVLAFMLSMLPALQAFSFIGMLLAFGAIYGAYYLITAMNIEYEYSITNGEMDVDKIVSQRKRTRLCTVKLREVEAFGKYKAEDHTNKTYEKKVFACDSVANPDLWYCVSRVTGKGQVFLVFNANEKMMTAIKKYIPKPILHEVFMRVQ